MRVLGLCSYPIEAAATRFRMSQFVGPLRDRDIELDIHPFLDSERFARLYSQRRISGMFSLIKPVLNRIKDSFIVRNYDLIFVQREAMIFGPAFFEWLYQSINGRPMVLDLDDATYVRYVSPSYGRLASTLKFFGKTDNLIRQSKVVICGNRFIARYAEGLGARTVIVPTVVDTNVLRPRTEEKLTEGRVQNPTIGWIGTHSTLPFLEKIFPVLAELAKSYEFTLKIVGAGREDIAIPNVAVENLRWELDREVTDFQSIDIGLYPVFSSTSANEEWLKGKSGFKAIEYMAAGVPFVMSPVGICADIGVAGATHFLAEDSTEWYDALGRLLESADLRKRIGAAAREFSVANYDLETAVLPLTELFRELVGR